MPGADAHDAEPDETAPRQHVQRVRGARRAKLTPAPGTDPEPLYDEEDPDAATPGGVAASGSSGPNDAQLRRDVPPHY